MGHRRSGQCAMRTWMNDDFHTASINASNCKTHRTDLLHMRNVLNTSLSQVVKIQEKKLDEHRWGSRDIYIEH